MDLCCYTLPRLITIFTQLMFIKLVDNNSCWVVKFIWDEYSWVYDCCVQICWILYEYSWVYDCFWIWWIFISSVTVVHLFFARLSDLCFISQRQSRTHNVIDKYDASGKWLDWKGELISACWLQLHCNQVAAAITAIVPAQLECTDSRTVAEFFKLMFRFLICEAGKICALLCLQTPYYYLSVHRA